MRIALLAYGSRGDIQPALALGDTLRRRGNSVVVTVNTNLVEWATKSGLEIVPMEPDVEAFLKSTEAQEFLSTGKLTAFLKAIAQLEEAANASIVHALDDATKDADLILSTILTAQRAMCIEERRGIPHGCVTTMPSAPTTRWASFLSPVRDLGLGRLNDWSHRLMFQLIWHQARKNIDVMRAHLGLAPARRRLVAEELPTVHVYSPHLAPRPKDWPRQHESASSCVLSPELRERLGEGRLPPNLDAWLSDGPPPIFFGFGSMPIADPTAWLDAVVEATRRRGVRALIGAGWSAIPTSRLPEHVFVVGAFDHDRVLPRCRGAVHHGGAGTTATIVRAGLPSYVLSVFGDQPFWGWRLRALGIGDTVQFSKLAPTGGLDAVLDCVLAPRRARLAQELGALLRAEDGCGQAAAIVERWGRQSSRGQHHSTAKHEAGAAAQ